MNYVISESTNPCVNLAMEERLLDTVQDGEATVYLWQNERTVVIGKNQNACAECNLTALREDGGRLVGGFRAAALFITIWAISILRFCPKRQTRIQGGTLKSLPARCIHLAWSLKKAEETIFS